MSELRKECYECKYNKKCYGGASYNSIYCTAHRKYDFEEVNKNGNKNKI